MSGHNIFIQTKVTTKLFSQGSLLATKQRKHTFKDVFREEIYFTSAFKIAFT